MKNVNLLKKFLKNKLKYKKNTSVCEYGMILDPDLSLFNKTKKEKTNYKCTGNN
jgi:hypothetical protein